MKTLSYTKRGSSLFTAVFALLTVLFASCSKDNSSDNSNSQTYTTQGDASGAQQNPAVTTNGTARLMGTYDANTNDWQYSIDWSAMTGSATLVEFHGPADAGVNGDILFSVNISAGGTNGAISGTTRLSEQQETYLTTGKIYYTIISSAHLTGELRGQVYVLRR